ncbi:MAG: YkgJ family cysteine cluster protein [Deltaproteobacteria bacterium]|nr:YkgJ family cysteine cluster protein [Deltaproteobacteria bacterium]MBW2178384.1 YkgJ family cysteine cluster protein [Deltaproteobacteria bacterium]
MDKQKKHRVDVDDTSTWIQYKRRLCNGCRALCCTMPVEATLADLVRMGVITAFEAGEPVKTLTRKLKKDGVVERYSTKNRVFTLVRFANNDCLYLGPESRKCGIYEKRPDTCRNHPIVGPRPGFCPFEEQ